ncbi:hypothetical protein DMI62_10025 [Escherichia coli]|nr:hypothetical protein [Escherichia coli]
MRRLTPKVSSQKIFTDANGTQHIGLHPIPDRSGLWRYLSTTLLLLTMLGSAIL